MNEPKYLRINQSKINYFKNPNSPFLLNIVQEGDGLDLLRDLKDEVAQLAISDFQYKDTKKTSLGAWTHALNKGYYQPAFYNYKNLNQNDELIQKFCQELARVLKPNGFLLLWICRDILLSGIYKNWLTDDFLTKEILVWKKTIYISYNPALFSNSLEYCLLIQKKPWKMFSKKKYLTNFFLETVHNVGRINVHQKPFQMTQTIIQQLTQEGDLVIDPCAGSFVSLRACQSLKRDFLGTDLTLRKLMKFNINKERSRELLKLEGKNNLYHDK